MRIPRPVSLTSTFTNDFDDSSDSSREASVQIVVEPHRHTFSVPSSDNEADTEDEEDEVQITSSIPGAEEEVEEEEDNEELEISVATTLGRQAIGGAYKAAECLSQSSKARDAPSETRGLNLKGPSLQDLLTKIAKDGTSQDNPINLEGTCTSTNIIDVDTESDDEGPEVVPFYKASKQNDSIQPRRRVWPQGVCDDDPDTQRQSVVPETQAVESDKDVRAESTDEGSDDFESEDDDGFDYDHEFFADDDLEPSKDLPAPEVKKPASPKFGNFQTQTTPLSPSSDEFHPARLDLSVSDAIDVSKHVEPSSIWTQRAPSPSDAALARKASKPKKSLSRDIFDEFPASGWPLPCKIIDSHSLDDCNDNAAIRDEHIRVTSWPELQSPEPRSYEQGPFSTLPWATIPSPELNKSRHQTKRPTVTWADAFEDDDMAIKDCFPRTSKQVSKITIPSLVETHDDEDIGFVKRNDGWMNGSKDIGDAPKEVKASSPARCTSGCKRTFAEANLMAPEYSFEEDSSVTGLQSHTEQAVLEWMSNGDNATQHPDGLVDQSIPLPDAQPREDLFHTLTSPTSQSSVAEPTVDLVSPTTLAQGQGEEGPSRKKARTSSSSPGGIGKFVMGVGCGLLGAAAAFIATIPASVYEEALREFGNAA